MAPTQQLQAGNGGFRQDGRRPPGDCSSPDSTVRDEDAGWKALVVANTVVQMIDPRQNHRNPIPPPVFIEKLIADRKDYGSSERIRLPALSRDIEIDYTALSFVMPQRVGFRYKLEGRDQDWQEPGTRRQAFYTGLSPGSYRFRVIACNNTGLWNEVGASLPFSIAPPTIRQGGSKPSACLASRVLSIRHIAFGSGK